LTVSKAKTPAAALRPVRAKYRNHTKERCARERRDASSVEKFGTTAGISRIVFARERGRASARKRTRTMDPAHVRHLSALHRLGHLGRQTVGHQPMAARRRVDE